MLDKETWLSAAEAKAFGFIDEIRPAAVMTACLDASKFKNIPAAAKGLVIAQPEPIVVAVPEVKAEAKVEAKPEEFCKCEGECKCGLPKAKKGEVDEDIEDCTNKPVVKGEASVETKPEPIVEDSGTFQLFTADGKVALKAKGVVSAEALIESIRRAAEDESNAIAERNYAGYKAEITTLTENIGVLNENLGKTADKLLEARALVGTMEAKLKEKDAEREKVAALATRMTAGMLVTGAQSNAPANWYAALKQIRTENPGIKEEDVYVKASKQYPDLKARLMTGGR